MFAVLMWCKSGYAEEVVATLCPKMHQRDLEHFRIRVLSGMARQLKGEINMPSDEEFRVLQPKFENFVFHYHRQVMVAADGTETRTRGGKRARKPGQKKTPEEQAFSKKKKQHSLCWAIMVLLTGVIIWYSPASLMHNDQSAWNHYALRSKFEDKTFGVVGDGGYTFNYVKKKKGRGPSEGVAVLKGREKDIIGFKPFPRPAKRKGSPEFRAKGME